MTDADLLKDFAGTGESPAFTRLVERYAPMVLSTCRRQLGDAHEAEDAAQAVFIALVRKARSIRPETLAPWLQRVAVLTSRQLLRQRAGRLRREKEAADMKAATGRSDSWERLRPELDGVVAELPWRYRQVVAMHYLAGKPVAEVARELGKPAGTVTSLLSRAVERLRAKLGRQGVSVPAAALAGMLAERAVESVPAGLAGSLAAAAVGQTAASAAAVTLAEGTMKMMMIAKVKLAAAVVGAALAVGGGGGLLAAKLAAAEPVPAIKVEDIKTATVPERKLPEPAARGKGYPVPPTKWEQRPVLWGWTCELPDGSGLAFGGISQQADDGNPHTRIREGGQWKPLVEELRRSNSLQKNFSAAWALRNACKDALARVRHLFFEGKPADEEAKLLKADVDPAIEKLSADLAKLAAELKGSNGPGDYEAGQAKFALKHLDAAAGMLKPFGGRTTPEQLATMRKAQIELEIASEAFDAEPAPRALSFIAFEPKTRLYVVFGGEHMDYVTNDLWVFDPARRRWFQRHPEAAPEPRADHRLDPLGDGRVAMYGGFRHGSEDPTYMHVGPARWIYDVERNAWSADGHQEKMLPADSREYWPALARYEPEFYMKGARPDAAANEAKLKTLPVNTWVELNPPVRFGGRDWGTMAHDPDRDMLYYFGGGHSSYGGNDVARYHLATNRWEQSDPTELPLGGTGSNEQYPSGFNFNLRPWMRPHPWNSYAYDPLIKKMVLGGATTPKLDPYCYLYDPDKADWSARHRVAQGMNNDVYGVQLRPTKHGLLAWTGDDGRLWLLDGKTMEWKKVAFKGQMPQPGVDSCGMVYDPKRDRMLFVTTTGYYGPCTLQVTALDFNTLQAAPLNPEGMNAPPEARRFCTREIAYHPDSDLFIWGSCLFAAKDLHPAYDPAGNRWVTVKTPGGGSVTNNGGLAYDAKRGLFWIVNPLWPGCGQVSALRLDPAKAELKPLKDFVPPPPPAGEKK